MVLEDVVDRHPVGDAPDRRLRHVGQAGQLARADHVLHRLGDVEHHPRPAGNRRRRRSAARPANHWAAVLERPRVHFQVRIERNIPHANLRALDVERRLAEVGLPVREVILDDDLPEGRVVRDLKGQRVLQGVARRDQRMVRVDLQVHRLLQSEALQREAMVGREADGHRGVARVHRGPLRLAFDHVLGDLWRTSFPDDRLSARVELGDEELVFHQQIRGRPQHVTHAVPVQLEHTVGMVRVRIDGRSFGRPEHRESRQVLVALTELHFVRKGVVDGQVLDRLPRRHVDVDRVRAGVIRSGDRLVGAVRALALTVDRGMRLRHRERARRKREALDCGELHGIRPTEPAARADLKLRAVVGVRVDLGGDDDLERDRVRRVAGERQRKHDELMPLVV